MTVNPSPSQLAGKDFSTAGDRLTYVKAVLAEKGWPDTSDNEQFLLDLAMREHATSDKSASAAWNLFNSERTMPGSTFFNHTSKGAGVQNYATMADGVKASAATLTNGNYKNIVASLAAGTAATDDAAGKFVKDLGTWSGGSYTTVSNTQGQNGPLSATGLVSPTGSTSAGSGSPDSTLSGDLAGFIKSQAPALERAINDPTVNSLLTQWGNGSLSDQEFQAQLEDTKWFKSTSNTQRQFLVSQATDPGTAAQTLTQKQADIQNLAQSQGIALDPKTLQSLATQALSLGWDSTQISNQVAQQYKYNPNATQTGQAAISIDQMKQDYKNYALPVSQTTIGSWAQKMLAGTETDASFKAYLSQQAQELYKNNPNIVSALQSGKDVSTAMQPYADLISQETDVPSTQVNWLDPRYNQFIQGTYDPQSGKPVVPTLGSVARTLRTDPQYGWTNSQGAIQAISSGISGLTKTLGFS